MKLAERFRMALAAALLAGTTCAAPAFADEGEETPGMVTLTFVSMGEEVESREVSDDGLVGELPSVSEPGYDLIGWFDDFGQQIFDYTPVAELSSYTIYAEWSIITYKIMYRDGTNVIPGLQPSSYKVIDKTVVLPTDAPKSGYLFNGWYDNIGLKGDPIAQFDATDCEDKTYYAKYEVDAYPLWIAGRQVTGANATNVLGDAAASVSFAGTATNGTLTLRDAAIEELLGDGHAECGIYAGPGFALTIAIEGTNLVGGARFDTGVRTDGPLEIVGGGALAGIGESTGIDARNGLAIDEATVFAEGKVEGIVYGELAITNGGVIAAPPWVANVAARQRWPWNGLVDVDYEVGGFTAGLSVRISFAKQGDEGRPRVATRFLAGTEPSAVPGRHRATWDAAADGAANFVASNLVATVALVEPDVWLLPPGYVLLNGDIYDNQGDKLRSADYIDTDLIIAPGDSCTCLLISSYENANGDTRYKQIEAKPAVAVESDEKDMFTTVADAGQVTVTVNDGAPIGSSAAISCSVAGCQMKNSLTFATASMRGIKLYLPESGRPQRYDKNAWDVYARVVPFADNSREVEAGATYQKATLSNDRLDELLVRDFSYIQNGNTFVQNMYKLEASVPDPAAKVLVLFELRAKNAADGDWGFVMPSYMIDLSKSLYEEDRNYTENDYVPYDADYFFPLWTAEFNTNQTPFGTYKGNAKTKAFKVGDGVGFHTGRMTGSEGSGQGLWTIGVSHVRPLDATVIEGGLDDGNMKAVGTGETCLLGSWYGVEGIVYPIHFTELSTNPSTYSAEPTLLSVTE